MLYFYRGLKPILIILIQICNRLSKIRKKDINDTNNK